MPDILIRGMEYPKSCSRCDFASVVPGEVWCKRAKEIVPEEQAINVNMHPTFCPLHELPEHGDLIDRDALKHKFCTHCDGYEYDTGACVDGDQDCMDAKIIMTAPVIVPSNKEETE